MIIAFLGLVLFIGSFLLAGLDKQTSSRITLKPYAWSARIVGVLILLGGIVWSTVTLVPAGYAGVLLRFGAVQGTLGEGMHMIVPGVNSVYLMETRTQKVEAKATAASRDLQVVTTSLALNYRLAVGTVGKLYAAIGPDYSSRIIDPTLQESVKVVTSSYTAEDLIRRRAEVKAAVELDITRRLAAYNIIVDGNGLSITNFDFSPEFNKAIEAKQVAQQEAEKQKYVLAQAELQKQTAIAKAEGAARAAQLNADALRVQGGELVIAREWIEKWDGKLPEVAAGGGGGNGGLILDISSLMRRNANP